MRLIRDFFIAAVVTVGVFGLIELGLRLAGVRFEAQFYTLDNARGFAWRPHAEGWEITEGENYVRINRDGMLDKERRVSKPARTLRIAVIGSSEVAAQQVPLDKTFESVLDRRLNEALQSTGYHAEVLNFGVDAYNQAQDYLTIRDKIWKYRPDIVVFACMPAMLMRNSRDLYVPEVARTPFYDIENGVAVPDRITRNLPPVSARSNAIRGTISSVVNRSQILLAIDDLRNGLPRSIQKLRSDFRLVKVAATGNQLTLLEQIHDPNIPKLQKSWQVADALFDKMSAVCNQNGAEFWLVVLSSPYSDTPNLKARRDFEQQLGVHSLLGTDQRLADVAASKGAHVALLSRELADYAAARQIALHGFYNTGFNTGHFNVCGNAVIGDFLAKALLENSPTIRNSTQASRATLSQLHAF